MMKRFIGVLMLMVVAVVAMAQQRKVQNKPYIDLRPLHFGIHIGLNLQDVEFRNVGPQLITVGEGDEQTTQERTVLCDADTWNPGFSVGVVADMRLSQHLALRVTPTMHFGSKRLTFRDMQDLNDAGTPRLTTQDMKNTYIALPLELKFAAERFNNYRPYMLFGVSPMINLTGKDQEYVQLKRFDTHIELGMGCDFYLPFFKFIPELKFCYGLGDVLDKSHVDELTDVNKRIYAQSVANAKPSKMFVLSFYFE